MANTLIFLLQLLNRVESLVQTKDEQAIGVNGNWEARVEAALVDVGAVGAAQVRHQQPPIFLLQPSVRARNCIFLCAQETQDQILKDLSVPGCCT